MSNKKQELEFYKNTNDINILKSKIFELIDININLEYDLDKFNKLKSKYRLMKRSYYRLKDKYHNTPKPKKEYYCSNIGGFDSSYSSDSDDFSYFSDSSVSDSEIVEIHKRIETLLKKN